MSKKVEEAMSALKKAFKEDPEYAWSWHCNLAMAAQDQGLDHYHGNHAAARFMQNAFNIDTTKHDNFKVIKYKKLLSPSESVFGFAAWLTTQKIPITASSKHDAGIWAEKCAEFCKVNNLPDPVDGWESNLTHPPELK